MEYSLLDQWPKDDDGTPEPAALLCNGSDYPDELALMCSLLESFSIPHYAKHQGVRPVYEPSVWTRRRRHRDLCSRLPAGEGPGPSGRSTGV